MDSHETQIKGDTAELQVAAAIRKMDYTVLFPFTESEQYDIAVDTGDKIIKVQIKYAGLKNDTVKVSCYGPNSSKSGNNATFYTEDDIDGIAAWCDDLDRCFWIPYENLNKYTVTLSQDGKNTYDKYSLDTIQNI